MATTAFESLALTDLVVDATYESGMRGNAADDPLARLLPVGNQGGFRYRGSPPTPNLVVLLSTGKQPAWPDVLDPYSGTYTYYGDNRKPGHQLHDTSRRGNLILAEAFRTAHGNATDRASTPVFLVFHSTGVRRDVQFLGLAVPGAPALTADEDLVAVWRSSDGQRFQNYRATFTILAVPVVTRRWLDDVVAGCTLSPNAAQPYRRWVENRDFLPLVAPRVGQVRTRNEQLPRSARERAVVAAVHNACSDDPVSFERVAVELWRMMTAGRMDITVTRPTRDGGRDALGSFFLGPAHDQINLEFSLEAKCYGLDHGVGVRDVSRLVSRIRHREFGVFVTTSYIADQAYREVREDAHPIVFLVARDIVDLLRARGVSKAEEAEEWVVGILSRPVSAGSNLR